MEEETTGQVAEPEAPPGEAVAEAEPVAAFEADHAAELRDDFSNLDALIEQARAAAMAETTDQDEPAAPAAAEEPAPPATAEAAPPPETPTPAEPDYAALLADLQAKGYKVEAPAPAPDPYQQLIERLSSHRGTNEAYAEARQKALAFIPAEPPDYSAESVASHERAVKERNEAAARLERFDAARAITDDAIRFGRERSLGEIGAAFSAMPETYGLSAERAKRVTEPQNATDAVAAIVEQVTERLATAHEAKLAEREKYWQGEVARAKADRTAAAVQQMGRAPQPGAPAGGKPAANPFTGLFDQGGMVSDDVIERAKRGELASLDLTG